MCMNESLENIGWPNFSAIIELKVLRWWSCSGNEVRQMGVPGRENRGDDDPEGKLKKSS